MSENRSDYSNHFRTIGFAAAVTFVLVGNPLVALYSVPTGLMSLMMSTQERYRLDQSRTPAEPEAVAIVPIKKFEPQAETYITLNPKLFRNQPTPEGNFWSAFTFWYRAPIALVMNVSHHLAISYMMMEDDKMENGSETVHYYLPQPDGEVLTLEFKRQCLAFFLTSEMPTSFGQQVAAIMIGLNIHWRSESMIVNRGEVLRKKVLLDDMWHLYRTQFMERSLDRLALFTTTSITNLDVDSLQHDFVTYVMYRTLISVMSLLYSEYSHEWSASR